MIQKSIAYVILIIMSHLAVSISQLNLVIQCIIHDIDIDQLFCISCLVYNIMRHGDIRHCRILFFNKNKKVKCTGVLWCVMVYGFHMCGRVVHAPTFSESAIKYCLIT